MTKLQEVIDSVQSSPSSIFTKEDVMYLLELANQKTSDAPKPQKQDTPPLSTVELIERIKTMVIDLIEEAVDRIDTSNILDERNIDLGLSGNEIIIENVDIDMDGLSQEISDYVAEELEEKLIDSGLFTPDQG